MKRLHLKFYLTVLTLLLNCYIIQAQYSNTVTIYPDKDAYMYWKINDPSYADNNYGGSGYMRAEAWTSSGQLYKCRGIIQINLDCIPANATITDAKLYLYSVYDGASWKRQYGYNACYMQKVTEAWKEDEATWNNIDGKITTAGQVTIPKSTSYNQDYIVDITDMVQDWVTNGENYGVLFRLQNEAKYRRMIFGSSDHADSQYHPKVEITYELDRGFVTFHPSKDALILDDHNSSGSYDLRDNNYGSSQNFYAYAWSNSGQGVYNNKRRGLMEFDLSEIPQDATVFEAKLTLHGLNHWPLSRSNECYLKRNMEDWGEYDVTWNNAPGITEEDKILLPQSTSSTQNYEIDITDFIKKWVAEPDSNFGFLMTLRYEQKYTRLYFASGDHSDPSKWPALEITFQKIEAVKEHASYESPSSGSIELNIPIGNPPYNFVWRSGETTPLLNNLDKGLYEVMVIDQSGNPQNLKFNIGHKLIWAQLNGVEISDDLITRTATGNDWINAYAVADNQIPENADGTIEFTLSQNNPVIIIDLLNQSATAPETRSQASLRIENNCISVFNASNQPVCSNEPYTEGDVLRIERDNGIIYYYLNSKLLGTEDEVPTQALVPAFTIWNSIGLAVQDAAIWIKENIRPEELTEEINYIKISSPRIKVSNVSELETLTEDDLQKQVRYFDGLGRNIQNVIINGSQSNKDVYQPREYDEFGREPKKYLPYTINSNGGFRTSAIYEQKTNFCLTDEFGERTTFSYAEVKYDDSPLNRVLEQGAPGATWQLNAGHTVELKYSTNTNSTEVRYWKVDAAGNCINPAGNEYYSATELYKTKITDENETESWEYKNKQGRVILKKTKIGPHNSVFTYYVYDDFGLLRFVIPPQAYKEMNDEGDWTKLNETNFRDKWIFCYKYDERHRMVEKKIPGKEKGRFIYNNRDQLILFQDGNMQSDNINENKFLYTKYDAHGRPVITGIYSPGHSLTRDSMQAIVENFENTRGDDPNYEERTGDNYSTQHGYTNRIYPTEACEILTVNYYDDYDFNSDGSRDYNYTSDITDFPENEDNLTYRTRGLLTGTKTRILGQDELLVSVPFYDKYGNVIQTRTYNNMGGYDRVTSKYDFVRNLTKSKHYHWCYVNGGMQNTTILNRFEYDHGNRLIKTYQKTGNDDEILLTEMNYNERSELIEKNLHSPDDNGSYLQSVDYNYNIRGWLIAINRIAENPVDALTRLTENDLFGMNLSYDRDLDYLDANAQYNGNISAIKWQGKYDGEPVRGYGFQYDKLNRLTNTKFARYDESNGWTNDIDRYNVSNITYDMNGNIQTMSRNGKTGETTYGLLDELSYDYDGNRLKAVQDNGSQDKGFVDNVTYGSPGIEEYYYDNNGNMVTDDNKGIDEIVYNHLNLPEEIYFVNNKSIKYIYDANGIKLRKEVYIGTTLQSAKDYVGNFIYHEDASGQELEFILTDEGRILPETDGSYTYEYFIKDHLGNTRVSFRDDGTGTAELVQEDSYYPFGLTMGGLSYVASTSGSTNKYLYQGQELQDDHSLGWYQFDLRMYDPAIGRFTTIDPFSQHSSPYLAMSNNPLSYIDPTGGFDYEIPGYLSAKYSNWEDANEENMFDLKMRHQDDDPEKEDVGNPDDSPNEKTSSGEGLILPGEAPSLYGPPSQIDLQGGKVVTELIGWFAYINSHQNQDFHVSDVIDANTIPKKGWFSNIFGSMTTDAISGTSKFGNNMVEWTITDRNFINNYKANYINNIFSDNPGGSMYRIRAMDNNYGVISIILYNETLYNRFFNQIFH